MSWNTHNTYNMLEMIILMDRRRELESSLTPRLLICLIYGIAVKPKYKWEIQFKILSEQYEGESVQLRWIWGSSAYEWKKKDISVFVKDLDGVKITP